ncbi:MAG: hypothetical protein NTY65_14480, partial [Planctomycetota bacterium]|nr:hypothetical protein [Planctomycetota bacterium]
RSRRRAERIGLGRVYLEFLKKIHRLCRRHGKRMNAWADIVLDHPEVLGDVPRDIVMLNWDYRDPGTRISRTHEITDAGLACVVCPGTNSWNSHGCRLDLGMRNIRRFAGQGLACGAEGLLNTDWGDNGHRNGLAVSLHNYAYGAAHSWSHRGVRDEGFTERFCSHTFGASSCGMPEAIRTLGGAHEALGLPDANDTLLYSVFFGPMREFRNPEDRRVKLLAAVKAASLAKHREALQALRWPRPAQVAEPLLRTALEEFAVATHLDAAACLRAGVLKRIIEGGWPPAAALRELAAETEAAARELARVWLLGNKPSRLRDNLAAMRRTASECRRLARL